MNVFKVSMDAPDPKIQKGLKNYLCDKLIISAHTRIDIIPLIEILYIKAESNYSLIMTKRESILASSPLKKFENHLSKNLFARVHASFLINLNQLSHIEKNGHTSCIMKNGDGIPVSNKYKKDFIDIILNQKI
jgi:two-component system LytT family response regulator